MSGSSSRTSRSLGTAAAELRAGEVDRPAEEMRKEHTHGRNDAEGIVRPRNMGQDLVCVWKLAFANRIVTIAQPLGIVKHFL